MAVNPANPAHRARIESAVRNAYEAAASERANRRQLIDIYRGTSFLKTLLKDRDSSRETLMNYMQLYVRGRLTVLAATSPKWFIRSRVRAGKGFDKRIQSFLNRYTEVLNLHATFRACALDSAFGRAVIKVVTSVAPKGVSSIYAPRAFRISPDNLIVDRATLSPIFDEATFVGDIYMVPLSEAKVFEGFSPEGRANLSAYQMFSGENPAPVESSTDSHDLFVEDMTRLVDIYFPTAGVLATWPANSYRFSEIGSQPPLAVIEMPINPYEAFDSISLPNSLAEFAPMQNIKELHFLANDMLHKAAAQARASKRNPIGNIGAEDDMNNLLNAPDNEPVFTYDKSQLDLYTLPGPDPSLLSLAGLSGSLLSQQAGNLEVALGQSAGAQTARQTQALLGQIQTVQALDRDGFEKFMANVGKKLATLAFHDDTFALEVMEQVPGTNYVYNMDWGPPQNLPRVAAIDDYFFEVVPYSSSFRTPQERVNQLQQVSQMVMQWMTLMSQGAPLNIEAIITDLEEAFDLVGDVQSWWSGEPPQPAASRAMDTYSSLAGPAEGSDVSYNSNAQPGGEQAPEPQASGLQNQF